jgi:hypothetical protein
MGNRMKKRVAWVAFLLAAMVWGAANGALAGYWNVGDDFSATNNPNGVWSYGDYGGATFTGTLNPATFTLLTTEAHGYGSIDAWQNGVLDPVVSHNSSRTLTVGSFSDPTTYWTQWAPNEVALHPWDGPTVVRWTAPSAGEYQVSGDFFPTQGVNAPANAYIYMDATQEASLGSVSSTVPFSLLLNLNAGDTVDFVAWGGNTYNKTTGLDASISTVAGPSNTSSVPEPSSLAGLLSLGVSGVIANIWRRRRRS